MSVVKAKAIITLSEPTRELLSLMSFPEIPSEANYLVFTEDGDAQFLEKLDMTRNSMMFIIPNFSVVSYYKDMTLSIE